GRAHFVRFPTADGHHDMAVEIEADERHVLAKQLDALVPAEHRLDAGKPGYRLLVLAIGIGERKIDASLHRLALPHFVEQIVHGTVRPTPLPTTLDQGEGDAGTKACGSNSPIRRAGWVGNRSSTSLR